MPIDVLPVGAFLLDRVASARLGVRLLASVPDDATAAVFIRWSVANHAVWAVVVAGWMRPPASLVVTVAVSVAFLARLAVRGRCWLARAAAVGVRDLVAVTTGL
jgi:hypothetical protein